MMKNPELEEFDTLALRLLQLKPNISASPNPVGQKNKLGFVGEEADASGGELFAKSSAKIFEIWFYENNILYRAAQST